MLGSLRSMGAFDLLAATKWRRQRVLILCYHGVALLDEHEWHPDLFVTRDFLRRRFELLRDHSYTVLGLGDAVQRLAKGTLPPRSVVLTFDDGFHNFAVAAAPLLEEFEYPATVYLPSYYCIHQRPILALTVRYWLWRMRKSANLDEPEKREAFAQELLKRARSLAMDREKQIAWLADLAKTLGIDWREFTQRRLMHLMTPNEVAEMARRGFDVQLHTHRHRMPRDAADFRREIVDNRDVIAAHTGRVAHHFCYPSGHYGEIFLPWLRELQVYSATTCVPALAAPTDNPLMLPRFVDTSAQSELVFEAWLCGAGSLLRTHRARRSAQEQAAHYVST
ncbi:MAG: polysaccharide deacetylase family protein [Gammaproteobacteria bacterium]